ncbi:hypothetical protein AJ80_02200 [Polytolypa hystricis UAMH7299]|uniref:Uncharacterized protein n=1 Tax=Polytolypa hystricis (strain UAMH7299) TaxID=1447883 RepID=A0A2B7YRG7_POLH7|nr:hypothetical protein AJ80_02200 [Polytolypa hystricis UAMH7299]
MTPLFERRGQGPVKIEVPAITIDSPASSSPTAASAPLAADGVSANNDSLASIATPVTFLYPKTEKEPGVFPDSAPLPVGEAIYFSAEELASGSDEEDLVNNSRARKALSVPGPEFSGMFSLKRGEAAEEEEKKEADVGEEEATESVAAAEPAAARQAIEVTAVNAGCQQIHSDKSAASDDIPCPHSPPASVSSLSSFPPSQQSPPHRPAHLPTNITALTTVSSLSILTTNPSTMYPHRPYARPSPGLLLVPADPRPESSEVASEPDENANISGQDTQSSPADDNNPPAHPSAPLPTDTTTTTTTSITNPPAGADLAAIVRQVLQEERRNTLVMFDASCQRLMHRVTKDQAARFDKVEARLDTLARDVREEILLRLGAAAASGTKEEGEEEGEEDPKVDIAREIGVLGEMITVLMGRVEELRKRMDEEEGGKEKDGEEEGGREEEAGHTSNTPRGTGESGPKKKKFPHWHAGQNNNRGGRRSSGNGRPPVGGNGFSSSWATATGPRQPVVSGRSDPLTSSSASQGLPRHHHAPASLPSRPLQGGRGGFNPQAASRQQPGQRRSLPATGAHWYQRAYPGGGNGA